MVSIAEKVPRAVSSHLTVRIDLYLLTVIAGLSLSPVQSRSWSFPLSSPSVECAPVAVGFLFLCVFVFLFFCAASLSSVHVAHGDPFGDSIHVGWRIGDILSILVLG